jgi:hypothetical protein
VIVTDHKVFDYPAMVKNFPPLVDTRNALKGVSSKNIFRSDAVHAVAGPARFIDPQKIGTRAVSSR